MNKIIEKLKGVLEDKDLVTLEEAIKKMVEDKVTVLVEEKTAELENLAEEFTNTEVEKRVTEKTEEITETYDEKMEALESKIVESVDKFLASEINENISEATIEKMAINETYKPIVESIMSLFEDKFVALDTEGHSILREAKEEIEKLEETVSTAIAEKMELNESVDTLKVGKLIAEKTDGLSENQKERVLAFFEGKDFEEVFAKIDNFLEVIEESSKKKNEEEDEDEEDEEDEEDSKENTDVDATDEEEVVVKKKKKNEQLEESNSMTDKAGSLL